MATAKRFPLLTNSKRKAIAKRSALYANTINWQVPGNFENYYMQRYRFQQFLKKSVWNGYSQWNELLYTHQLKIFIFTVSNFGIIASSEIEKYLLMWIIFSNKTPTDRNLSKSLFENFWLNFMKNTIESVFFLAKKWLLLGNTKFFVSYFVKILMRNWDYYCPK